jgi:hypothetical protein
MTRITLLPILPFIHYFQQTLITLDVRYNRISDDVEQRIIEILKTNGESI